MELFARNPVFGHFGDFLVWNRAKLAPDYSKRHLQHGTKPFFFYYVLPIIVLIVLTVIFGSLFERRSPTCQLLHHMPQDKQATNRFHRVTNRCHRVTNRAHLQSQMLLAQDTCQVSWFLILFISSNSANRSLQLERETLP